MRHNFSRNSDYHTQRNNLKVPFASCNTTSMVMALKQAGWKVPEDGVTQPEDALTEFLSTPAARDRQKAVAPASMGAYRPQEVHAVLEWGTNAWLHDTPDSFTTQATSKDLVATLKSGGGVVLSGRFPMDPPEADLGHIVSVAGYIELESEHEVTRWILDDPYGDWHTRYKVHRGNDIQFTRDEFTRIFDRKGDGHYWAHLIRSNT